MSVKEKIEEIKTIPPKVILGQTIVSSVEKIILSVPSKGKSNPIKHKGKLLITPNP